MTEDNRKQNRKPEWRKPRLDRIGTIRDIAQVKKPGGQASNGKFS